MSNLRIVTGESDGKFYAYLMGKSKWHAKAGGRYDTELERDAAVARMHVMIAEHESQLAARRKARSGARKAAAAAVGMPYKVGDVLVYSWGYDQTNVEFFQVVETKARSVVIRRIASRLDSGVGQMSGMCVPEPGRFVGEPIRKTVQARVDHNGKPWFYLPMDHGSLYAYEGKPMYVSWYA